MTARDFALHQLDEKALPGWPAGLIRRKPSGPPADPRDLALAEHIVVGVIKNLLLLQHLITAYSNRKLKSIDLLVQKILAVGLYQIRFLTRVPASAAVDQAVEQAKRFGQSKASGFVNAVLRKATREPQPALPTSQSPAEYARIVLSHPPELFERIERLLGPADAVRFCEHDQLEPPVIVRVTGDPRLLASEQVELTPHEEAGMFVVNGARRADFARWAKEGVAQVQDPTAAKVAGSLDLQPDQGVLDRCCGLGTKTLQLRAGVGDAGHVVAIDPSPQRCQGLRTLLRERGLTNVAVYEAAWMKQAGATEPFDRILADVPCSNSGVLARRPEARYVQSPDALASLARLQDRILADTAPFLRPGGLLVYSTCSVWPEENQERIDAFLAAHPDFEILREEQTWPSFDTDPVRYHDGGYFAVLRRK